MKVLVLGGYGVFGERVARLLQRDGHALIVAGRSWAKAQHLAETIGAQALRFDRASDLDSLAELDIEVLVDAAGPFHAYGERPYALVEACLRAGIHYLDLADDADFCVGIGALDGLARACGRTALSGVSSVPALSAAAVHTLALGLEDIESIDTVILPGNRAPRGLSVMRSILEQCGRARSIWLDGRWQRMHGWTRRRRYILQGDESRPGYRIGVPDLDLFPNHFKAGSVSFRAGLELDLLNRALALLSWSRQRWPWPITLGLVRFARWITGLLQGFGSDRGGMVVEVIGRERSHSEFTRSRRCWTLLAERGDGPWVPAMPVRALLRRGLGTPGARPCLDALDLADIEAAMGDCQLRTRRDESALRMLFASVPGLDLGALPVLVRDSHAVFHTRVLRGRARVERGAGLLARLLCRTFGFPPASEDVDVEVCKTREGEQECWQRRFGAQNFRSWLRVVDGRMRERFGVFEFELDLQVIAGALHFPVRRGWLLGLRQPHWLLPRSEAREYVEQGRFHFDVDLVAPMGIGHLVRYRGSFDARD